MKFAISGATGFIGVHLIHHLLLQGHEVIGMKRESSKLSEFDLISNSYPTTNYSKFHWHNCDLDNAEKLEEIFGQVQNVVHAAGFISYHKKNRNKLIEVNAGYTASVVDAAVAAGVDSFCLLSSTSAISKRGDVPLLNEEITWDPAQPFSNYGLSKHLAELEFWRGREEGLKGFIVNPGVVLGYGDWNKSSVQIFKKAKNSFPIYSDGITGFTSVQDLAAIVLKLFELKADGERYLVVNQNASHREVLNMIADNFSAKRPKWAVGGPVLGFLKLLVSIKELLGIGGLISRETLEAALSQYKYDNSKVIETTGHTFKSLDQVIEETCSLYKKSLRF